MRDKDGNVVRVDLAYESRAPRGVFLVSLNSDGVWLTARQARVIATQLMRRADEVERRNKVTP